MDDQAALLLNPSYATPTAIYLFILSQWGVDFCKSDPDASHFLSQIEVTCIMHNKMPVAPEHEFLVIETQDRLGKIKSLILERTVGLTQDADITDQGRDTQPGDGFVKLLKKMKQIGSDAVISGSQASYLSSMEEGSMSNTLSALSSLGPVDKATLLSTRSADILSDSLKLTLDDHPDSSAIDQFLGERYVFSPNWHGQNIRHFKPKKTLSLFELAILADVVHNEFPKYTLLKEQCYFFAGLIYSVIEYRFGVASSSKSNEYQDRDLVQIDGSRLSNKFGRWRGALISNVDHREVLDIVSKYEVAYALEIAKVNLHFQITT